MRRFNLSIGLLAFTSALTYWACSGPVKGGSSAVKDESAATSSTFKLYDKRNFQPDPTCDVHTLLVLETGPGGNKANLSNVVTGQCELFVNPNPRTYSDLQVEDDGCGSKVYTGQRSVGSEAALITITDNRARTCENVIPALIVVNEKSRGFDNRLFSKDDSFAPIAPPPASFKLYDEPDFEPNPTCDVHTLLVLETGPSGNKASLSNVLSGQCELFVNPNRRTYTNLQVEDDGCGSKVYTGQRSVGSEAVLITITDNRARTCENVIPALIVVNEKSRGFDNTLFSQK